jgi:hypothetical protein
MRFAPENCGHCGRFIPAGPIDAYAPWGGAADQEPPDDVLLCPRCADDIYERALAWLLREGIPPYEARSYWMPPNAVHRARGVARGMFRHGLVKRPVRHERVRYETVGRSGTFRVQEWCACGWSTGLLPPGGFPRQVDYLSPGTRIRDHVDGEVR